MALTKDKKSEILEKLKGIASQDSLVFVNFHGLSVEETTVMRQALREAGVSYFVTKKTLIGKAFENSKIDGAMPSLDGEVAVAWTEGNDVTGPAREIYTFQKKHDGNISILGGVFEGSYQDKTKMEEIATIPSIDVLRGMFVNVINSPIQGFAMVVKAKADSMEA